ncbi:hypothetical protein G6O67_006065 [Ophiocordyceps sinensis]|uniref:Uncharacterized protein n=1 Tax=Ophiocordyceps sinensis TaxID=72228 RepID=A0A8H4PPD2_9HYPO|nr:hypothetical protein G6O67_006065 [Ophiocordyceps sinensis]
MLVRPGTLDTVMAVALVWDDDEEEAEARAVDDSMGTLVPGAAMGDLFCQSQAVCRRTRRGICREGDQGQTKPGQGQTKPPGISTDIQGAGGRSGRRGMERRE